MKYDFAKVCQELWGLIDLAPSLYLSQKCWRVCSHYTHAWQPDDVKSLCKQASGTYPVSRVSETKWHKHRRHIHCHALLKLALFSCLACTDFFGNCCPKCESLAVTVQVHTGPFSILATTHQVFAQQGLADDKKACRLNYIHLPTDRTACSACNPILVPHLCTLFHSSSSWSNLAFASSQLDKWYITALKSCIDPASGIVLVPVVSNGHSWNFYQLSSLVLSIIQHICYFLDFGGGMNANEIQMRPQISLLFAAFFSLNWLELVEWWTIYMVQQSNTIQLRATDIGDATISESSLAFTSQGFYSAFELISDRFQLCSNTFSHFQDFWQSSSLNLRACWLWEHRGDGLHSVSFTHCLPRGAHFHIETAKDGDGWIFLSFVLVWLFWH